MVHSKLSKYQIWDVTETKCSTSMVSLITMQVRTTLICLPPFLTLGIADTLPPQFIQCYRFNSRCYICQESTTPNTLDPQPPNLSFQSSTA